MLGIFAGVLAITKRADKTGAAPVDRQLGTARGWVAIIYYAMTLQVLL